MLSLLLFRPQMSCLFCHLLVGVFFGFPVGVLLLKILDRNAGRRCKRTRELEA